MEQPGKSTVLQDSLRPEARGPNEVFIESIDEQIQLYGTNLRNLKSTCRGVLDDDNLGIVVMEEFPELGDQNRQSQRTLQQAIKIERAELQRVIVYARNSAEIYVLLRDEATLRSGIKDLYAAHYETTRDPEATLKDKYHSQAWIDVYEAEKDRCETEKSLRSSLEFFLNSSPNNIVSLVDWLSREDIDPEEYRPFFTFLAKNTFDPTETSIISDMVERLKQQPGLFVQTMCNELLQNLSNNDNEQINMIKPLPVEIISWITFIAGSFLSDEDKGNMESVVQRLASIPYTQWPDSLREYLVTSHEDFLTALHKTYQTLVGPYKEPSLFYIPTDVVEKMTIEDGLASPKTNTKRGAPGKRKQGRTTTSTSSERLIPKEQTGRLIDVVATWSKSTSGHIETYRETLDQKEDNDIVNTLLMQPAVASYIASHSSDSDLRADLPKMLISILDEPRGNGATKLTDSTVSFSNGGGSNKSFPVWHLNPNKRSNLSVGDTARQTRIYYVLPRDAEGNRCLVILKVDHKNTAEKIRTSLSV